MGTSENSTCWGNYCMGNARKKINHHMIYAHYAMSYNALKNDNEVNSEHTYTHTHTHIHLYIILSSERKV